MEIIYYLWKQIGEIDPSLKRQAERPSAFFLFSIILIVQLMREIKLTQGKIALIDDSDYELVSQYHWYFDGQYAKACWDKQRKTYYLRMHRLILGLTDPKIDTDHINHNKLDNRRLNLRTCSRAENLRNRRAHGRSEYLGVYYNNKKYITAQIHVNGKTIHLGTFDTEEEAAIAYDNAAKQYHKEFANLNFK
jgi:hypothetical protein